MKQAKAASKRAKSEALAEAIARTGRDEMNLAEFPTSILTTRPTSGVKTLRFKDSHGQLTVTGSDALGLPTPIDTDVLIGLIELTKKANNFKNVRVNFTRYELIRLIGWANVGPSYTRLKESLDRWAGVLLIYDGCWWDNRLKQYVSKTVHIIEDVMIAEGRHKPEKGSEQQSLPLSSFTWSQHFKESFDANNLKTLDTELYFSLELPTSKQLYRFLDKRFGGDRPEWVFSLEQLAYEHVGLSRNYTPAKIKEKLGKAIDELEQRRFLRPLPRDQRYFKATDGWKIRLIDGRRDPLSLPQPGQSAQAAPDALAAELIRRGVSEAVASRLAREYPERVAIQIEILEWENWKKPGKIVEPAAFLVRAIERNNAAPKAFIPKAERERQAEAKRQADYQAAEERRRKQQADAAERRLAAQVTAYLKSRTSEQTAQIEADALAQASPDTRDQLNQPELRAFRKTMILQVVRAHVVQLIETGQLDTLTA